MKLSDGTKVVAVACVPHEEKAGSEVNNSEQQWFSIYVNLLYFGY